MFSHRKYILFDMDGTLIDSVGIWNLVDETLIARLRRDGKQGVENVQQRRDELLRQFRETPQPYMAYCGFLKDEYAMAETPQEIHDVRYAIATELLTQHIDYKPGADTLLRRLREQGHVLALVSATARKNMEVYRQRNENIRSKAPIDETFSLVYTREDAPAMKPDPAIYRMALTALEAKPAECLVFEDSLAGVEAAKNAGLTVAAMYDKYSDGEREQINALADYTFESFAEVLDKL